MSDYTHDDAMADLNAIAALVNNHHHGGYSSEFIDQIHESRYLPLKAYIKRIEAKNERLREVNLPFTEEERLSLLNDALAWRWFNLGRQDERIRQDRLAAIPTDDLKALVCAIRKSHKHQTYECSICRALTTAVLEWAGVE